MRRELHAVHGMLYSHISGSELSIRPRMFTLVYCQCAISGLFSTSVELKRGVNHFVNVERFTSILIPGRKDRYGYFTVTTRHSQWAQKRKAVHGIIGIY